MYKRLVRLIRRTNKLYDETGSVVVAANFFVKFLFMKISLLATHFGAALRYLNPINSRTISMRHEKIKAGGCLYVAITVSGGLGDLIVIARSVRDFVRSVEPLSFDVFAPSPALARWVFSSVQGFKLAYPDSLEGIVGDSYDFHIGMNQLAFIKSVKWSRVRGCPRVLFSLHKLNEFRHKKGFDVYITNHPRLDNGLARKVVYMGLDRNRFLGSMLGIEYSGHILDIEYNMEIINRVGLQGKKFITVHNGFDSNFIISGRRATKCYPFFEEIVRGIKKAKDELIIVQIGTGTSVPIPGVDLNLIGATNLKEAAGIIRSASLHIDNEGGLVHLAACYGVQSLVIYGPTPSDFFGYGDNINVDPKSCGGCWWIDELWMDRCPRGLAEPECMLSHSSREIVSLALELLNKQIDIDSPNLLDRLT